MAFYTFISSLINIFLQKIIWVNSYLYQRSSDISFQCAFLDASSLSHLQIQHDHLWVLLSQGNAVFCLVASLLYCGNIKSGNFSRILVNSWTHNINEIFVKVNYST